MNYMITYVRHYNYIGRDINLSLDDYPVSDREVYCKKRHEVCEPLWEDCKNCPHFGGWMQGQGHECVWEDVAPYTPTVSGATPDYSVQHKDRHKELLRVSKLIDQGTLQRG